VDLDDPRLLFFYKVTCPVCQMAAPVAERLGRAYPGRIVGVGQDPAPKLWEFAQSYGMTVPRLVDPPPYPASVAYGVRVVPTLFVVADGRIDDVVESWDRDGYNRAAGRLAALTGAPPVAVSSPDDGLPVFRPG
jgi:thiol-disulfide isomerase/thioredoxin